MRIHIITETYPPEVNGVAMTIHRLVSALSERGHKILVIRPRQHRQDNPKINGTVPEWTLPGISLPRYKGLHAGLPAARRLIQHWNIERPEIVHVVTEGPLGWSAVRAANLMGIPVISGFHTNYHSYGKHYGFGRLTRVMLAWLRFVHNRTRATFVPSADLREVLAKDGFKNLEILGRGVDTQLFSPDRRDPELRKKWGLNDDDPAAIYAGRIAGEKNLSLTVKSFLAMREECPELKCVLVGDGPEREKLQAQHPDFIFTGMKKGEDLARHYASGDVFVFASVTETFGNVVTEAMASGLVVLAYDYAAAGQYIRNNLNGVSVPYNEEKQFVEAARRIARRREEWPDLRHSARVTARTISWNKAVNHFEAKLKSLAGAN